MPVSRLSLPSRRPPAGSSEQRGERLETELQALESCAAHGAPALTPEARDALREVLWEDVTSEYDARFLSAPLSAAFVRAERAWAAD